MLSDRETVAVKKQQEAEVCLRKGKLDEAIAACGLALEALPDFAPACKTLGDIMQATGQLESAGDWYEKALASRQDWAEVHANLGTIYARKQEWQLAISCYQKAISLKPNFAGFYRNLAKVWKLAGKADLARDFSERAEALEKQPRTVSKSLKLAKTLVEEGKLPEAIACYRQAIELNPSGFKAYHLLGDAWVSLGDWDEAIGSYKKALEIQPNNSLLRQKLGKAFLKKGDFYEAVVTFQQAIKINPNLIWSYHHLGDSLMKLKNWDAAINAYRKAVELNSQKAIIYNNLGLALTEKKHYSEAVEAYQNAINLKQKNHSFYHNLGNALSKQGKTGKAISVYKKAIALKPERGEYYSCLADCLRKNQRWDEAIASYSKAIELNPQDSNAYYLLGKILEEQKKWDEAIAIYERGLERCPQDTKLTLELQNLLRNLKCSTAYERGMLFVKEQNWDRGISSYQELLKLQPWQENKVKDYLNLGTILVKAGKLQEIIESYHQVFNKNLKKLEFYYQFSIHLSQAGLISEAVTFFKHLPSPQFPKKPKRSKSKNATNSAYEYIWNSLHETNSEDLNLQVELDALELESGKIKDYFSQKDLKTLAIDELHPKDRDFLENCGILWEYVKSIGLENHYLENIYINCFDNSNDRLQTRTNNVKKQHLKKKTEGYKYQAVEFTQSLVEFGYMYAVCPLSGRVVRSNTSFYLGKWSLMYRFKGQEIFYIIVNDFIGSKTALYIPKLNVCIAFAKALKKVEKMGKTISTFQSYVVSNWKTVQSYLNSSNRSLTEIYGTIKNLGHFFWQDITGIYYLHEQNLLEKIDYFCGGDNQYLNLLSIFPEIPEKKILDISKMSEEEQFRFVLKNNFFCLRITDNFIKQNVGNRIIRAADNLCSQEFIEEVKKVKEHYDLLLWINVRSHNKVWVEQDRNYAKIIDKLSDDFSHLSMAVVFDGTPDANEIVKSIVKKTKSKVGFYNQSLKLKLYESITWSKNIDAYIAVVGSGLVITSWLTDKPGVAHGDSAHLGQECFWSEVKESGIEPTFLSYLDVKQSQKKAYNNYQVNWRIIYQKLLKIIKKIEKNKGNI